MNSLYEYECIDIDSMKLFVRVYASSIQEANEKLVLLLPNYLNTPQSHLKAIVEIPEEHWKEDVASSLRKMANNLDEYERNLDKIQKEIKAIAKEFVKKETSE